MMNDERKAANQRPGVYSSFITPHSSLVLPLITHRLAVVAVVFAMVLSGCGTVSRQDAPSRSKTTAPAGGGYYLDDGPGTNAPADLASIPDAVPKIEPLGRGTMRPYTVMGRNYTPMTRLEPYKARGIASWYGRRYHGKQTSSGEIYDMYAMSAAHTVLPIPSYVRVTNISNGKSVVVRVNDRGPFIDNRLIDLSYTAAWKLGILNAGSGMVEVESIIPGKTPAADPPSAAPSPSSSPTVAVIDNTPVTAVALPPPASIAAPAPVLPSPAATPTPAAAGGAYLQFGAFGVQANAENYLARLQSQADWLAGSLRIQHNDGIYRVQAGPYPSESAAREAAERASQALGAKPVVIIR